MRFDLEEVSSLPHGTVFIDRKGREIAVPGGGGRLATRADLPEFLVNALRAREDARFFEHHGVDVRGLMRATLRNLKDRDFTQGASTLSMQLARNVFQMRQKSLHRKFLEIALTLRIEARYTKDEILTHYLNRIYFGAGADGISQAAETYFGKPVRELNDGQCALVVGIIRGPHIFSPFRNLNAALEQRDQTLNRMVAMGLIDQKRRDAVAAEPIALAKDDRSDTQTSYALQAVRRELDRILDDAEIAAGGLRVKTTLDAAWQGRLETELNHAVEQLEREKSWAHPLPSQHQAANDPAYVQYAAVTTETGSGAVLALIGGRNFQHSRFDRTRSSRDLGSAFEPFVAAAASERGGLVLPGKPVQTGRQIGAAEVERLARRCGGSCGEGLAHGPQLFCHLPRRHATTEALLQPQPAVLAVPAQLPARQHGLHPRHRRFAGMERGLKESEGQQHPGPGQGRGVRGGAEPAEGGAGETLGQLEAPRSAQLQAVAAAGGGDAQPRSSVPEEAKAVPGLGR